MSNIQFMKYFFLILISLLTQVNIYASDYVDSLLDVTRNDTLEINKRVGAYYYLGNEFSNIGSYKKSLQYYETGLSLLQSMEEKNLLNEAVFIENIGMVYNYQGYYQKALKYCIKSLKFSESLNNELFMAGANIKLGIIYKNIRDYEQSLKYFKKGIEFYKNQNNLNELSNAYNSVGILYYELNNYDLAIEYYNKSMSICDSINDNTTKISLYNNIGLIELERKQLESAKQNFNQVIELAYKTNDSSVVAVAYSNLAILSNIEASKIEDSSKKKQKLKQTITLANKALEMAVNLNLLTTQEDTYVVLYKVYNQLSDTKKELHFYKLFTSIKDSIFNLEMQDEIKTIETTYKLEKKDNKIKLLQKEQEVHKITLQKEQEVKEKQQIIIVAIATGLGFVILFLIFIFNRLRLIKKQKTLIEEQKELVDVAFKESEEQKEIIEKNHREITDSIIYAKHLQNAILPSQSELNKYLPNNFILYKPKTFVSGDFYWFEHINGISYLAVADCTGHGVPGAMVSVVCSNALNRTIKEFGITQPAKILDKSRDFVIDTFKKSEDVKEGMDTVLCAFNKKRMVYSGANNPLWIIRTSELITPENESNTIIHNNISLIEYKANKQPVGFHYKMKEFTQQEIELFAGDILYLFTDGFPDQFGGPKAKKFKYLPFKKFLMEIHTKPMTEQKQLINDKFNDWKGEFEQIDDLTIIGIRV